MTETNTAGSLALYGRLFHYLRRYWKIFVLSLISMSIAAATEPALGLLMKPLVDKGFVAKDPHAIVMIPLMIIGLFLLRGVTSYINEYSTSWLTGHLVQTLREEMFGRLIRMPSSFYEASQSSHLLSRVAYDVNMVTDAGFNVITVSVKDGITVLGLLGVLFYTDWQLTLICFLVFPAVSLCIRVVGRRLRGLSRKSQQNMAQLTQVLSESIDGQRIVKVYGGQDYEAARFSGAASAIRHNSTKQAATSAINTGVTQFLIALALAAILYFAAMRAQQNALTPGAFMSFLTNMAALFAPVKRITNISQSLQRGLAAAESVFTFLDLSPEVDKGTVHPAKVEGHLVFENVDFRYPGAERDALTGINLDIRPGETIALVGASGSGKSTLVSLLPRFHSPTSGRILLDGHDLNDIGLGSLRAQVALVSQEVVLFNDTIAANIAYGRHGEVSREAILEAARQANALEFISALPDGLDTVVGERGSRLSGGQRQRIAIARALLKNAPILILDEATSALDTQSERLVQHALETLMQNRTTIVIAHRLSTIESADRIVVMQQGHMVEIGDHASLLRQDGVYATLHRMQFRETPFGS